MEWILPLAVTVTVVVALQLCLQARSSRSVRGPLPPGPRALPLLGNLHQLPTPPWFKLAEFAETFGDIMLVRLGSLPAVFLSSPAAIKAFHLDHGRSFLSRPRLFLFTEMSQHNQLGIVATNGDVWKHSRKIAIQLMLTKSKFPYYEAVTATETRLLLTKALPALAAQSKSPVVSDVHERIHLLLASVLLRICIGRAFESTADPKFLQLVKVVDEYMALGAEGYLGDFFPLLRYLPSSYRTRTREFSHVGRNLLNEFVQKAKADREQGKNLEDCMLTQMLDIADKESLSTEQISALLMELVGGGMDTTATTVEWVLIVLANYPHVQERLRQEINDVLRDRPYTADDSPKLPYLSAVIYETIRWVVVAPIPIPRVASEDVSVRGFLIPKGTVVFMNMYACFRDAKTWPEPHVFRPERFLEKDYDVVSCHDPEFAPFSVGARHCPGARLSAMNVAVVLSMMLQHYRLKRPTDALLSIETTPGLVCVPKHPPSIVFERL